MLSLPFFALAKPRAEAPSIHLRSTDTLYIQVIDNVGMHSIGQSDRFRRIKNTLEEVFEAVDFPLEYRIARFGAWKTPPGQPRLDLTITRWGDYGMSEIEVRFMASIRRDYDRNKLGFFYKRGGFAFGTSDQVVRVYNDVLRKALVEMVSELNDRLALSVPGAEAEMEGGEGDGSAADE